MNLTSLLSAVSFANPLVLWGLLVLPLVWLIARATPPAPRRLVFPPAVLLGKVPRTDEATTAAPWWLRLLRMLVIALALLGLAGPRLDLAGNATTGPLVIVIDNGWSGAPNWNRTIREAATAAGAAQGQVRIVFTAPDRTAPDPRATFAPARAASLLQAATPVPLPVDHARTAGRLATVPGNATVLWWSDGLRWAGTPRLAQQLTRARSVQVRLPDVPVAAITGLSMEAAGARVRTVQASGRPVALTLQARDASGRVLGSATTPARAGTWLVPLSPQAAREVAEVRIAGQQSAAGVRLLDAWDRRSRVGLVAPRVDDQPLLSDAHYLEAALEPYADLDRGEAETLARAGYNAIILPDTGLLQPGEERALTAFVEGGGVLIRFAGPDFIESRGAQLSPVEVAQQPRILSGSLAWQQSGTLARFDAGSPFSGLAIPADARIRTLAVTAGGRDAPQSGQTPGAAVWAELSDGTPVVSARQLGRGLLVLYHTTAGPAWSDVAFSGLQTAMLRRTIARASTTALPAGQVAPTVPLKPVLLVDGAGRLRPPDSADRSILPAEAGQVRPDLWRWPGIYQGGPARILLQPVPDTLTLEPIGQLPTGVTAMQAAPDGPVMLAGPLLGAAAVLLVTELVLTLMLAGAFAPRLASAGQAGWLARLRPARATAVQGLVVLAALLVTLGPSVSGLAQEGTFDPDAPMTQEDLLPQELEPGILDGLAPATPAPSVPGSQAGTRAVEPADSAGVATLLASPQQVHLAFLKTGDPRTDQRARQGLQGLSLVLAERTSVVPGEVVGLDASDPALSIVPVLYWLIPETAAPLPEAEVRALNRFMRDGGLLFIDTADADASPAEARRRAGEALRGLSMPPLQAIPPTHVITKSFYLLQNFPGRYGDARLWTESAASAAANANDGVSPVLLGNGDWAAAWARTGSGEPLASVDGDQRQREMAFRVGVNAVLYALTGNYKSDQVHIPALLERIGADAATGQDGGQSAPNDGGPP